MPMDKMKDIDLEAMKSDMMAMEETADMREDEMYSKAAPAGRFSGKTVNALIDAANRLLPLFGIKDQHPRMEGAMQSKLPASLMRLLSMVATAISDAIDAGMLEEDAVVVMDGITDDAGLQGLAGRLNMAAKSAGFKKFLKQPKKVSVEVEVESGGEGEEEGGGKSPEEMSTEDMDAMFASRM